jgi:hypothetical protein
MRTMRASKSEYRCRKAAARERAIASFFTFCFLQLHMTAEPSRQERILDAVFEGGPSVSIMS